MVGTEATAEQRISKFWRIASGLALSAALTLQFVFVLTSTAAIAQQPSPEPIRVSGNSIYRWQIGDADASLLEGGCVISHQGKQLKADAILLVVDGPVGRVRTRVVADGVHGAASGSEPLAFTLLNLSEPKILAAPLFRNKPQDPSRLLKFLPDGNIGRSETEATAGADQNVKPVQFAVPEAIAPAAPEVIAPPIGVPLPDGTPPPIIASEGTGTGSFQFFTGGGSRSVEILARGASTPPQIETFNRPDLAETVILARGGVTVLIRDVTAQLPSGEFMELGTISLSADRVVGWLPLVSDLFNGTTDMSQADGELYLEGDIVFRQGERIIYAESMYYNINLEQGMVLNAEAITTIPEYQGVVRLKADVLQQVARGNFIAFDAAVTSSRMGVPRYWLQTARMQLTDRERMLQDPKTGAPVISREPFVESSDNFVYFGGVPLLYWPTFATSLQRPAYYLTGFNVRNGNNFGTQVLLDFDIFQLLGIENVPDGVESELSIDYLSDRGPAIGTTTQYNLPGLFGVPGPVIGYYDSYLIRDRGRDTLGLDRQDLEPEKRTRGRTLLRHRHYLPNDFEFAATVGYIRDRNFLEMYLENEWDQGYDQNTGFQLRKYLNSNVFDLTLDARVNKFFTQTEQLPFFDHHLIGGSILRDHLTWSMHNRVGYARLKPGRPPENPVEAANFSPTPGVIEADGVIASTRQKLSLPTQLGPVKVIPSVSGEVAHYGEAANGESLTRLLGQAGLTTSLSAWRVDPTVQSSLLNVRGLAHNVEWIASYFYADSDTNIDELPLYDPLDDNAQEQFRHRFISDLFGGVLPPQFDPRLVAFRQGYQSLVASPSDVVADDLQQFRFGLHQRWQTKRGLPGRERIVDLFQFDVDFLVFPKKDRDNFGETMGPATYDMRYHIGDRVTLLSDGYIDFFSGGLRSISGGFQTTRPGLGELYMGLLSLEGPISSTVLLSTLDYRMNEKWIVSAGTTYDFGATGNVGQSFAFTRVGESLLLRVGVNVDRGRDNVGVGFAIEPRFWPRPRLGRVGGQLIPPPGVEGLE